MATLNYPSFDSALLSFLKSAFSNSYELDYSHDLPAFLGVVPQGLGLPNSGRAGVRLQQNNRSLGILEGPD